DLPVNEAYRIIFMDRDLDEVLLSQEKMLTRLGRSAGPREEMKRAYRLHLERLHQWLPRQRHLAVLGVSYNDLVRQPRAQAERGAAFLGGGADGEGMARAVAPPLSRTRKPAGNPA